MEPRSKILFEEDVCKFAWSQKQLAKIRAKSTDSWKACASPGAFNCLYAAISLNVTYYVASTVVLLVQKTQITSTRI